MDASTLRVGLTLNPVAPGTVVGFNQTQAAASGIGQNGSLQVVSGWNDVNRMLKEFGPRRLVIDPKNLEEIVRILNGDDA